MRVDYQFYAERKKLPPVGTFIIFSDTSFGIASNGKGLVYGVWKTPPETWNVKSKGGSQ